MSANRRNGYIHTFFLNLYYLFVHLSRSKVLPVHLCPGQRRTVPSATLCPRRDPGHESSHDVTGPQVNAGAAESQGRRSIGQPGTSHFFQCHFRVPPSSGCCSFEYLMGTWGEEECKGVESRRQNSVVEGTFIFLLLMHCSTCRFLVFWSLIILLLMTEYRWL